MTLVPRTAPKLMEKPKFIKLTKKLLSLFLKHKKPYYHRLFRKTWLILPGVFYTPDVAKFIRHFPSLKGKSFLEIGCGAGIVAIEIVFRGTKKVVATDINKTAITNARKNAKRFRARKKISFRIGNLFAPIKKGEQFDYIFFNPPFGYITKKSGSHLAKAVWDEKYRTLKRFLSQAKKYLAPNGKILLAFSTIGHIKALKYYARQFGYSIRQLFSARLTYFDSNHYLKLYEIMPRRLQ